MLLHNRIFLTGSSGFLGSALRDKLCESGFLVRELYRSRSDKKFDQRDMVNFEGFESDFDLRQSLAECDVVVHCAGLSGSSHVSPIDCNVVNTLATLALARQAIDAGVKRFIFLSTVKVSGENTLPELPLTENHAFSASDSYSVSKLEAEIGLMALAASSAIEVIVIRPPLIYGPGVKGNFLSLLKLARSGWPLPLGATTNLRSMIYVGNLVDLIVRCITTSVTNQVFLASDSRDISTCELMRVIRSEMKLSHRLLRVPPALLYFLGGLLGKKGMVDRLCGSLQVDCSKVQDQLGWSPPYTLEYGIAETVKDFLK